MKHYIIVKWNGLVNDKNSIIKEVEILFKETLKIEGINKVEIIKNVVNRANRYDLIIRIDMEEKSLEKYDHCDAHLKWKEKYSKYIESKAIFDSNE